MNCFVHFFPTAVPGGPGGLGGQHVAPGSETKPNRNDQCHLGDEVPQSTEVRIDRVVSCIFILLLRVLRVLRVLYDNM